MIHAMKLYCYVQFFPLYCFANWPPHSKTYAPYSWYGTPKKHQPPQTRR